MDDFAYLNCSLRRDGSMREIGHAKVSTAKGLILTADAVLETWIHER